MKSLIKSFKGVYLFYVAVILFFSLYIISFFAENFYCLNEAQHFDAFLTNVVPAQLERYKVPGIGIGTVEVGKIQSVEMYGFEDTEKTKLMREETLFRAESITKMFTTYGIMKLVEEGKIALNDPVSQYLTRWHIPESAYNTGEITFKTLLNHSSGLPSGIFDIYTKNETPPSLEEALSGHSHNPEAKPDIAPGTVFRYSNQGYALLELLIEEIAQQPFEDYMAENILSPLNMTHSTFKWNQYVAEHITEQYDEHNRLIPNYRSPVMANGGLHTNVPDLLHFLLFWVNDQQDDVPSSFLSEESLNTMHAEQIQTSGFHRFFSQYYGLGHFIDYSESDQKIIFHMGQGAGGLTLLVGIPQKEIGLVILTNSTRSWQLIVSILNKWLNHHRIRWNGISTISLRLRNIVVITLSMILLMICFLLLRFLDNIEKKRRVLLPNTKNIGLKQTVFILTGIILFNFAGFSSNFDRIIWILPNIIGHIKTVMILAAVLIMLYGLFPYQTKRKGFIVQLPLDF